MGAERERVAGFGKLEDGLHQAGDWYRWGPYVSERQWGTVREDYSADGDAWDYLPHDQALFTRGPDGTRPCLGANRMLQTDPAWQDNLLFGEYFHGDNGAALGAWHQTGWTGLVADVIRRRYGQVRPVADIIRLLDQENQP